MIYERKICLAAGRDGSRYAVEQMSEAKNEKNSFYAPRLIAQRPKFQRPENRVSAKTRKNRRLLEEEVSRMKIPSFMESVCTILRRSFALELRGTTMPRFFDQIYCCEWNSLKEKSA